MWRITLIALMALLLTIGCKNDMNSLEKGDPAAARKVLIAGTTSEFKQNVVDRVIEKLGVEDCYFKITGLDQLNKEEIDQFDAILLVARFAAGRMDGRVTRFLEKYPANEKTVVFP